MRKAALYLSAIALLNAGGASADVRLPKLVGDHMVLQRDAKVHLWGWADPGENIRIAFHGRHAAAKADREGNWSATLGPFPAGGPYEMTVKGKNSVAIHDIFMGDVWLASGQSNMEFPLKAHGEWKTGVNNAENEVAGANFPKIRLFKVHQKVAFSPAKDLEADAWVAVSPESAGNFSAVAYLFGRELHQRYGIPIGLIEADWGGTVAEAWTSAAGLKPFPEFHDAIDTVAHADQSAAIADHERYIKQKAEWERQHAAEDRGQSAGRAVWADPEFDATSWPKINEPQTKPEEALKGFDGAVWFRKEITIPENQAGKWLLVNLTAAGETDTTFFNGEKIGETTGYQKPRAYLVPAKLVKAGRNVIAIRMTGSRGWVGMLDVDHPDKLNVEINGSTIPLAGTWSYQPGPDLSELSQPSAMSKLIIDPNRATVLFNSMIHPLIPFRIKGAIWYQGESNALRAAQYRRLFPALIEDWRKQWGYEMPFLFVQLAGYGHNQAQPAEYPWADLREAQSMALALHATGMASAIDIGDEADIHPRNKQDVAHRLALAAAKVAYGEDIVYSGPTYQSMQIEGDRIRIGLSNRGSGLLIKDRYGYVRGFEIAAADGQYVWANGQPDGQDLLIHSDSVRQPISVRYDWSNTPDGNVFNKEGLPLVPFRTDRPGNLPSAHAQLAQDRAAQCAALTRTDLAQLQDAPTQITAASAIAQADDDPAYCEVDGYVLPNVGFRAQMPAEGWNGKLLQLGCGGDCGLIPSRGTPGSSQCIEPMRRGYACLVMDGGHTGGGVLWAQNNWQAQIDLAFRAAHVVSLAGKAMVGAYYGRPPQKSYFSGCSTGGQQALMEAQRFPWDFDGIIAGCATISSDSGALALTWLWNLRALTDEAGKPLLQPTDLDLVHRAVLAQCDMNDGVADGVIGDPRKCAFDPARLLCSDSVKEGCLSQRQVVALKKVYGGPVTRRGEPIYFPGPLPGAEKNWTALTPLYGSYPLNHLRYITFQPSPGAAWQLQDLDFDRDYQRMGATESLFAAVNPDLRRFKANGGKLLAYVGWNDAVGMPLPVVDYYETTERTLGGRRATQEFFRLFAVPGMGHCGGGEGAYAVDWLTALEEWVEKGQAPDKLMGSHVKLDDLMDKAVKGDAQALRALQRRLQFPLDSQLIEFTRPLFPYPVNYRYLGKGDPKDAGNFGPVN